MTKIVTLGSIVIIADLGGDRPGIVVKALGGQFADITAFLPLPEHLTSIKVHADRKEAITAALLDRRAHAYWG